MIVLEKIKAFSQFLLRGAQNGSVTAKNFFAKSLEGDEDEMQELNDRKRISMRLAVS